MSNPKLCQPTKGNTKLLRLLTKLSCGLNVDQRLIKGQDQMSI